MGRPIKNPFYFLLLFTSAMLLVTMFIYLVGWNYVPNPDTPAPTVPLPPWMRWVDRNAIWLIAGEVAAIMVLCGLTIGLDRFFDDGPPPPEQGDKS